MPEWKAVDGTGKHPLRYRMSVDATRLLGSTAILSDREWESLLGARMRQGARRVIMQGRDAVLEELARLEKSTGKDPGEAQVCRLLPKIGACLLPTPAPLTSSDRFFFQRRAICRVVGGAKPTVWLPNLDLLAAAKKSHTLLPRLRRIQTDSFGIPGAGCGRLEEGMYRHAAMRRVRH